ncbi:MAG: DUF1552 domain-containing protein [Planctomycetota bacterium]|jgi:hypothetical protein
MQIITGKHISRRQVLRGLGASVSLPFLNAMLPAARRWNRTEAGKAADRTRLVAIEMVHGAAGSNKLGEEQNLWAPAEAGSEFDLSPSSLLPLDPYRKYLTIVSNTDCRNAEAFNAREVGGDHFRSSAVFLTQAHPRQTEGSDIYAGTSMDQLYAQRIGDETPIPSMQLSIENVDQSGGCAYGYACVYTDTISWASPTDPLPMIRDPRVAFDQLFGAGGTPEQRAARMRSDRSILDWITGEVARIKKDLGPTDRSRLDDYLDDLRAIEKRIQKIEARNAVEGQEGADKGAQLPAAPAGIPESFEEHVKLMFDLQALAFAADMTRIFSFKMGRDGSARVYPDSGVERGFHPASHHGGREQRVKQFAAINKYHVGMVPYFLQKLESMQEGDKNMLEKTMLLYGSSMGDSNLHNHKRCPLFLMGHANGELTGNQHIKAPDGTAMADVMLSLMHKLGMQDTQSFGDSTGEFSI